MVQKLYYDLLGRTEEIIRYTRQMQAESEQLFLDMADETEQELREFGLWDEEKQQRIPEKDAVPITFRTFPK